MFDIGFWELVFIFGIALLVLGPDRLPAMARNVGLWVGRAKGLVRSLQRQIDSELKDQWIAESSRESPPAKTDEPPGEKAPPAADRDG